MVKKLVVAVALCCTFGISSAYADWWGRSWENIKRETTKACHNTEKTIGKAWEDTKREATNAAHATEVNGKALFNDVGEILGKVLCDDGTCCCIKLLHIKKSGNNNGDSSGEEDARRKEEEAAARERDMESSRQRALCSLQCRTECKSSFADDNDKLYNCFDNCQNRCGNDL